MLKSANDATVLSLIACFIEQISFAALNVGLSMVEL